MEKFMLRHRVFRYVMLGITLVIIFIYAAISAVLANGVTTSEREPLTETPQNYDLPYTNIQFSPRDGQLILDAWYITDSAPRPTIVLVHGLGSNRTSDGALNLTSHLWEMGFDSLLFDLRGHGTSDDGLVSGGYYEQNDLLGAFDFLIEAGVPSNNIGVLGISLGAAICILAASKETRIEAVVADTPYASITDLLAQEVSRTTPIPRWIVPAFIPGTTFVARIMYGIEISELNPEKYVQDIDYPIYVIHGEDDVRIPVDHSIRVHSAAHPNSTLWILPGVEHADAFITFPEEYSDRIGNYFQQALDLN